jgi:hypothetical protein
VVFRYGFTALAKNVNVQGDRFSNVFQRFLARFALTYTAGKTRDFCDNVTVLARI